MTEGEGRLVNGRYRLRRALGRGGMGIVRLANAKVLHRDVKPGNVMVLHEQAEDGDQIVLTWLLDQVDDQQRAVAAGERHLVRHQEHWLTAADLPL